MPPSAEPSTAEEQSVAALRRLSRLIALCGLTAAVVQSLATVVDVIGRELFAAPILAISDLYDLVIVFAAAACFPASLIGRQQVAMRAVGSLLKQRGRDALDLLGHLATLVAFGFIAWQIALYTMGVWNSGQTTWLLRLPVWPIWVLTSLFMALAAVAQLAVCLEQARRVAWPWRAGPGGDGGLSSGTAGDHVRG